MDLDRPAEERLANDPTSELWGEHRSRYRYVVEQGIAGLCVLDLACGAGFGLRMLEAAGAHAIGIDLDTCALLEARSGNPGTSLARADAAQLPLPDGSLDVVVSFETIEHVPDAEQVVAEFARVLRPGGRLFLSTPNRLFGPPHLHANNPFHIREFSGDELYQLLVSHFARVTVSGQWVSSRYRYVPFLMVEPPSVDPRELVWKFLNRLPYRLKDRAAHILTGRPFFPGEADYRFVPGAWHGAHALFAVAEAPVSRPARPVAVLSSKNGSA